MRIARKLCLQGWTQPLQILLYLRRPFSPRKKDHSSRHFLLRLIGHAPGASSAKPCPGACARRTPVWPLPAVPGWRASSPAWSCAPHPGPSPAPHPCGRCSAPRRSSRSRPPGSSLRCGDNGRFRFLPVLSQRQKRVERSNSSEYSSLAVWEISIFSRKRG